jgi:hypothetical protein
MEADRNFEWAEEAVGFIVQQQWPELAKRWRGVVPKDLGLNSDDWLRLSRRMLNRYKTNSGATGTLTDAARKPFHAQRLTMFVVALSDVL